MTTLTRRRNNDPHNEGWRIFYGDVQIGTISKRAGVPIDVDRWGWHCGFYPGVEPNQHRSGSSASYEQARAAFERAWRNLLPQLTPESFEVHSGIWPLSAGSTACGRKASRCQPSLPADDRNAFAGNRSTSRRPKSTSMSTTCLRENRDQVNQGTGKSRPRQRHRATLGAARH